MASDHKRRLKTLEGHQRNSAPLLTSTEISEAVERYEAARGGHLAHTPPSSAFRTMLLAMRPSLARVFLPAHPEDLML